MKANGKLNWTHFLLVMFACVAGDSPPKSEAPLPISKAIEIANATMRKVVEEPESLHIVRVTLHQGSSNEVVDKTVDPTTRAKLKGKLEGREYWLVIFRPPAAMFGGGLAVFIDATTEDVMETQRSR